MAGTHGDLFREIGALVVAAHDGDAIDLSLRSADLAERYINLGVPADAIARAIARSLGAVAMSRPPMRSTVVAAISIKTVLLISSSMRPLAWPHLPVPTR